RRPQARRGRCRTARAPRRRAPRAREERAHARARRRLVLHVARAALAHERRSARRQAFRSTRARSVGARLSSGPRRGGRLVASAFVRRALGFFAVVLARGALFPLARRFADGFSPSARFAALGGARRFGEGRRRRSLRPAGPAEAGVSVSARRGIEARVGAAE